MARTSNLANVATVSRATKAWYPGGWDFTNGGAITGDFVEYANNVARDGAQGLLVEESSTNEIRNPRCEGASGTTSPTNFSIAGGGITPTYEVVSLNGWPGVRVTLSGTASGTIQILFDGAGVIAASSGQGWTLSTGVILESGTFPVTMEHIIQERSSGGSLLAATNDQITPTSSHKRFVTSRTLTDGSTAFVSAGVRFPSVSGAVDCTFVILAPQLEEKAYPTSPILPPASSPAISDRDADDIEVASGAWLASNDGPFSLYAEVAAARPAPENFDRNNIVALSDGSFNNTANILFLTDPQSARLRTNSGGGADSTSAMVPLSGLSSPTGVVKLAAAWETDNVGYTASGGTLQTDTSATLPVGMDRLQIGADPAGRRLNGYIKNVRYWPRRLTNAELEALVGN